MKLPVLAFGLMLVCLLPQTGLCASVVGTVSNGNSQPVSGVAIAVKSKAGKVVATAATNLQGHYEIAGLSSGRYEFALNPEKTGFKAGTAVSFVGPTGLTINWKLSSADPALALARVGTGEQLAGDPFGYSAGDFAVLVGLGLDGVAAGVIGGYGGAGGFSSGHSASPAL